MLDFYYKTLISLFTDLNQLKSDSKNTSLCFSIQERVINNIRKTESRIRNVNSIIRVLNSSLKNDRLPRDETKKIKNEIKFRESKKESYIQLISVYRDIGDGIAFLYLSKWDIKPLCLSKEPAGFISGKKGLRLELKSFRLLKQQNTVGIFNDATHSIRHGDITIPIFGYPRLIELKSGKSSKNNERAQRQTIRANRILEYLIEDEMENIYPNLEGQTLKRLALSQREKHHRRKISNLLAKAWATKKNITAKIEDGLFYSICINEDEIDNELNKLPKNSKWLSHFVNQLKQVKQAYYPFTLSISNPQALYEFYNGRILIIVFIDLNTIEKQLKELRFDFQFNFDHEFCLDLKNNHTGVQIKISNHFFGRIAAEFLSLKWMVAEFCHNPPGGIENSDDSLANTVSTSLITV